MERMQQYVIGVDVGGTKIAAGLISRNGEIIAKDQVLVKAPGGKQVSDIIQQLILKMLENATIQGCKVVSVGISIPGIYFARTGCVWAPNIAGWENYPLHADLQQLGKQYNLAISIDSDRAAYILGETWLGAARGCKNAIYLAIGTGIGAGILVDGKILRGQGDIAGAVGWLALTENYRSEYARCGCFEYHAAGEGLVRVAQDLLALEPDYRGLLRQPAAAGITTRDIFSAYEANDLLACKVIEQAIRFWGMAVANLISTFNPEMIVLGGGVFGPAAKFLASITAEAQRWAQPISAQQVKITVTTLGTNAGLLGAGAIAWQKD